MFAPRRRSASCPNSHHVQHHSRRRRRTRHPGTDRRQPVLRRTQGAARLRRRPGPDPDPRRAARPDPAGLDAARHLRPGRRAQAAQRRTHPRRPGHHAHRQGLRAGQGRRPGSRRRRLHHQALLAQGADGPHQGRAAPPRAPAHRRRHRRGRPEAGPGHAPPVRQQPVAADRPHGIPPAAFLHDASGTRVLALAAARPGLGRPRVRRGTHRRRPYPPPAQGAGASGHDAHVETVRGSGYRFTAQVPAR